MNRFAQIVERMAASKEVLDALKDFVDSTEDDWNYVTPEEFEEMDKKGLFLLDIRKPDDYEEGHIKGAKNIFWLELLERLDELPKDQKIVLICYVGHTSSQALVMLRMLEYDVVALKFGMGKSPVEGVPVAGWEDFGFKTVKSKTAASKWVEFDNLPSVTRDDIIWEITERFPSLQILPGEVIDKLEGLSAPPMFLVNDMLVHRITGYHRKPYPSTVERYAKMLKSGSEAPPILVDGNKFIDGGHRYAAYVKAGRETIPTVDVGPILRLWNELMDGKADKLDREGGEKQAARYKKVEPTEPGSKNHYKVTYQDGAEKWTDQKPGRWKPGRRQRRLLLRRMKQPSVKRQLDMLAAAVKGYVAEEIDKSGLAGKVDDVFVALDRERAKESIRFFCKNKEKSDISDKEQEAVKILRKRLNDKVRRKKAMQERIAGIVGSMVLGFCPSELFEKRGWARS